MATQTFKIGLSDTDKETMSQEILEQVESLLFETYSSSSTYAVGDYAVYESVLYRCTTAVTSAESFDSDKWTQATLQDLVDDVNDAVDSVSDKADVDGYYETLTSGKALQLISTTYNYDQTAYNFRTSGGDNDIGNQVLLKKLVGGTLGFNQLVQNNANSQTLNDVVITKNDSGSYTFNGLASANIRLTICTISLISGHKYLLLGVPSGASVTTGGYRLFIDNLGNQVANTIVNNAYTGNVGLKVSVDSGASVDFTIFIQLFDLTAMFGSTIADYIYTLESGTTGAGVSWFRNLFPLDYYEYNSGTLLSTKASSKKAVGFNAFDYSSGTAQLVGGNAYQITGTYTSVEYTDINGDTETLTIDDDGYFTPTNNGTLTITGGDDSTTCVHLVWSGYRDGEYEEYVEYEYDLGSDILRGIPQIDDSGNLYFDGDEKVADGTITRNMQTPSDLSALTWEIEDDGYWSTEDLKSLISLPSSTSEIASIIAIGYVTDTHDNVTALTSTNTIAVDDEGVVVVYNGSTSTSPSGLFTYKLASSTTETGTAYTETQYVDDFGTEEFTCIGYNESTSADTTISIPCGNYSRYANNLRDKLQRLPDMPDDTGYYVVYYNDTPDFANGEKFCTFTDLPTWLSDNGYAVNVVPTPSTTQGTYVLKVVVDEDGNPTYQWVSE